MKMSFTIRGRGGGGCLLGGRLNVPCVAPGPVVSGVPGTRCSAACPRSHRAQVSQKCPRRLSCPAWRTGCRCRPSRVARKPRHGEIRGERVVPAPRWGRAGAGRRARRTTPPPYRRVGARNKDRGDLSPGLRGRARRSGPVSAPFAAFAQKIRNCAHRNRAPSLGLHRVSISRRHGPGIARARSRRDTPTREDVQDVSSHLHERHVHRGAC
jgi:hypothetical protein